MRVMEEPERAHASAPVRDRPELPWCAIRRGTHTRVSGLIDPNEWSSVMLILTRRVGETLMIGDQVTVTVLGVKGNQVRIGITAPKDVKQEHEAAGVDAAARVDEPEGREATNG